MNFRQRHSWTFLKPTSTHVIAVKRWWKISVPMSSRSATILQRNLFYFHLSAFPEVVKLAAVTCCYAANTNPEDSSLKSQKHCRTVWRNRVCLQLLLNSTKNEQNMEKKSLIFHCKKRWFRFLCNSTIFQTEIWDRSERSFVKETSEASL